MSDLFETPQPETPNLDQAFSELDASLDLLPENGSYITIRHEANAPVYSPLNEGETSIAIRVACDRRGLTLGSSVTAYVDAQQVSLDTVVAAGTVVMLVGSVKGG